MIPRIYRNLPPHDLGRPADQALYDDIRKLFEHNAYRPICVYAGIAEAGPIPLLPFLTGLAHQSDQLKFISKHMKMLTRLEAYNVDIEPAEDHANHLIRLALAWAVRVGVDYLNSRQ